MKFVRNNLNVGEADEMVKIVSNDGIPFEESKPLTDDKVVLESAKNVASESDVKTVDEAVERADIKEVTIPESLKDRFKIPPFTPTIPRVGESSILLKNADAYSPVPNQDEPVGVFKGDVDIPADSVKAIEVVNEIPLGVDVVDGANIVGELAPEVLEHLDELAVDVGLTNVVSDEAQEEVKEEVQEVSAPAEDVADKVDEKAVDEVESERTEESVEVDEDDLAWDKFVENVIVPTLEHCLDLLKEYTAKVLTKSLKDSSPLKK